MSRDSLSQQRAFPALGTGIALAILKDDALGGKQLIHGDEVKPLVQQGIYHLQGGLHTGGIDVVE